MASTFNFRFRPGDLRRPASLYQWKNTAQLKEAIRRMLVFEGAKIAVAFKHALVDRRMYVKRRSGNLERSSYVKIHETPFTLSLHAGLEDDLHRRGRKGAISTLIGDNIGGGYIRPRPGGAKKLAFPIPGISSTTIISTEGIRKFKTPREGINSFRRRGFKIIFLKNAIYAIRPKYAGEKPKNHKKLKPEKRKTRNRGRPPKVWKGRWIFLYARADEVYVKPYLLPLKEDVHRRMTEVVPRRFEEIVTGKKGFYRFR